MKRTVYVVFKLPYNGGCVDASGFYDFEGSLSQEYLIGLRKQMHEEILSKLPFEASTEGLDTMITFFKEVE